MKLFLSILFVLLSLANNIFSQDHENLRSDYDDYVLVPFNLGLWPGVSTADLWAEEAGNKKIFNTGFSLSLIGSRAARLRGVDLAGIFSIYSEGVQGVQLSGIFNVVDGNVGGLQGAGIFNVVDGDVKGVQTSGIFNIQNGSFKGIQGSGVFNMQNGDFKGISANGVFTIQNGNFKGIQGSGVFSVQNGNFQGLQYSPGFNIINGDFRGLQIGGLNIVRYFDSGIQVGFINITEAHDGVPIGFFSYVEDTPIGYQAWFDDSKFVNIGVRSGNADWYNLVFISRRVEGDVRYHTLGAGFGKKHYLGDNWDMDFGISFAKLLDKDFKDNKWDDGRLGSIAKLSLIFHYGLQHEGSLIFGPTLNGWYSRTAQEDLSNSLIVDEFKENHYFRVWPGFVVGLEF